MSNPPLEIEVEEIYCIYCRQFINETPEHKEEIENGFHNECKTLVDNFFTNKVADPKERLLYLFGLDAKQVFTLNEAGDPVTLNLSNHKLDNIPLEIFELTSLEDCNFANNALQWFHPLLFTLTRLKRLDLSGNSAFIFGHDFPEHIASPLEFIDLSNNLLQYLPEQIKQLTQLKAIYLHRNNFYEIPEVLQAMTHLQEFSVDDPYFESYPRWFIDRMLDGFRILVPNKSDTSTLEPFYFFAEIWLNYYKRGHDLEGNIVQNESGQVDVIQSLTSYKTQIQSVVQHLQDIIDIVQLVPDAFMDLAGSTHSITISGDHRVMKKLIEKRLVSFGRNIID